MRHRKRGRHLGRTSAHRAALRRNLISSLFLIGRIKTTPAKAKEVRSMAEKLITLGRKGGLANFRLAMSRLNDLYIVNKLFKEIAPKYADRPGGYTRILHLPASMRRLGDNAPQVILELVTSEEKEKTEAKPEAAAAKA